MTTEEKSNLFNLISQGDIQMALDQLLSMDISESKHKETISIASKYQKLKQQNRLGILSFEQSNLTENQITAHLIDLINHPDDKPFPIGKSIDTTNPSKPIIWKYVTAAAVIIGILGSLADILSLVSIFSIPAAKEKLQLTVFVTDTQGNVVLEHEGELNTSIGNRPMRETIGEAGRTNFGDILSEYHGDTIFLGFKAEGWEIADGTNKFIFTGEPIRLKVKKDDSLGLIKGLVKSRDGQEFIEGAKVMINTDTTILTDANGIFKVLLPEKMCVKKLTDAYKLTISKIGYQTTSQYYQVKSTDAEIRLEKSK